MYGLSVIDDNSCMDSLQGFLITSPDSLQFAVDSIQDVSCLVRMMD